MRIIHLSDLHFGTESDMIVNALTKALYDLSPDLVIVSGDFTQIGSSREFRLARDFLHSLSCDYLCVPGNHDVPARRLIERFSSPYKKYKKHIAEDLCPVYENEQVVVAGLNSARRALPHWNWANGAISEPQRLKLKEIYTPGESRWTICTFHHPVHKVDEMPLDVTVFGRKRTLQTIRDLKVDLVLTGHVHHASITTVGDGEHQTVYLSASTALSSRIRGQENGFNVIDLDDEIMLIEIYKLLEQGDFESVQRFEIQKDLFHTR